ncbi:MAG: DUF4389 domain-containing protein [Gammaproteobacteria bacterium]|nr:DUF4389 domain-containing protein [Gammaproteobacteria bacterium]
MTDQFQGNSGWQRVLFVALFWIAFYIAQLVAAAVVVVQCIFVLITNNPNGQLLTFGDSLSKYIHDILRFVTFNSDQRPFPFSDFPKPDLIIPAN